MIHLFGIEFEAQGAVIHLPNGERRGPVPLTEVGKELQEVAARLPPTEVESPEGELTPFVTSLARELEAGLREKSPFGYAAAKVVVQSLPSLRDRLAAKVAPQKAKDEKFMRYRRLRTLSRSRR